MQGKTYRILTGLSVVAVLLLAGLAFAGFFGGCCHLFGVGETDRAAQGEAHASHPAADPATAHSAASMMDCPMMAPEATATVATESQCPMHAAHPEQAGEMHGSCCGEEVSAPAGEGGTAESTAAEEIPADHAAHSH